MLLFILYLETDQQKKAINTLTRFLKDIEIEKKTIEEWVEEDYPDFVKSKIYLNWKKSK